MARITVEDCLQKIPNRFELAIIAAHRAKQLLEGAPASVNTKGNRFVVTALREIAASKVRFMSPEEIKADDDARQKEAELAAAQAAAMVPVMPPLPTLAMANDDDDDDDEEDDDVEEVVDLKNGAATTDVAETLE